MQKKKIVILGSTGSIGENAVRIAEHLPEELEVVGLVANRNVNRLAEQARQLNCPYVVTADETLLPELSSRCPDSCTASAGDQAVIDLVTRDEVDMVLAAIVGTAGLLPVLSAVRAGKDIALASKEVLVMAGGIVMAEVEKYNVKMLPVDSEHSALFQCLEGKKHSDVSRLILTASGGSFRNATLDEMRNAGYETALAHPTWKMGPKVTIDSASLMNKALEIVEAHWLFDIPGDKIDVVIHPQAVIHSMVEFVDGTILSQMSTPDMRFPIQYALTYPFKHVGSLKPLDFQKFSNLTFEMPDREKFPSLDFAYDALAVGGTLPCVMNAANEVAVAAFSEDKIRFTDIWSVIESVMNSHKTVTAPSLDEIFDADAAARVRASELVDKLKINI